MKKYLLKILLFFAIAVVVDFMVGCFGDYLQNHAKGGETKRINDLAINDCHDILILGSSRAHHHYDTPFLSDTLGVDIYNAGYDGNGVVLAFGLLELLLERYQPKMVLFDVEPTFDILVYNQDNNNTRYISPLKPYFRHKGVSSLMKDVSTEEWCKAHFGLIRYNSNLISMVQDYCITRNIDYKGYQPLTGCYDSEPEQKENGVTATDKLKLRYIEKLIQRVQEKNIPIVFLASPRYGALSSSEFAPVMEICQKYGVPFLDYYTDSIFMCHKEWFNEPMHLNQVGAREYTRIVESEISKVLTE